MTSGSDLINPIGDDGRIDSLDLLRGIAVMGMLIMNIQSFSMIQVAYINPSAYGDLSGANRWVWIGSHIIADQKFMSNFSILFGAGVILFTERLEARRVSVSKIYFRRLMWLLVAGLIHSYLLWHGDILVCYALCGFLAYWARKWRPGGLLTLGLVLLAVPAFNYWLFGASLELWPEEALKELATYWMPAGDIMSQELEAMRGGFLKQIPQRASAAFEMQTSVFLIWYGWRAAGFMLIGMALFKWDILSAVRSYRFYSMMTFLGLIIGIPLIIWGVRQNFSHNWEFKYSMFFGWEWNYIGSIFVAMGYVGKVMILEKISLFKRLKLWLSKVGKMAFSNYILMTILCTFIFYGHGLGLFGRMERTVQLLVVFAIWIVVVVFSSLWLKNHRYGPVEWIWRVLTYNRRFSNSKWVGRNN